MGSFPVFSGEAHSKPRCVSYTTWFHGSKLGKVCERNHAYMNRRECPLHDHRTDSDDRHQIETPFAVHRIQREGNEQRREHRHGYCTKAQGEEPPLASTRLNRLCSVDSQVSIKVHT